MILLTFLFYVLGTFVVGSYTFSIIGGHNATKGQCPYIASVQLCDSETCLHACGGVILNENWIVTAGHCIANLPGYEYSVAAGLTNLQDPDKQVSKVDKIIVHPGFNHSSLVSNYDIALIKLSNPLILNDLVKPALLPKEDAEVSEGTAILAGWGATQFNKSGEVFPDDLQVAELPIIDFKSCMTIITQEGLDFAPKYNNTIVCTGPMTEGIGACYKDSGGPLTQDGILIGLADWVSNPCGKFGSITVFTKVSSYVSWIVDVIVDN